MKKLIVTIITAAAAALLSGCADPTNLGNRALIQAAAVDYDGEYRVSALLFSSGGSGGDTIDASQENVIMVTGTGRTLSEAVDNVSLIDGKKIYMNETRLLIFGAGFERADISDALNTLYYELRCGLNTPVCCAEEAAALTEIPFTEGITSAEKPLSMIQNAFDLGVSPKTTLLDLLAENEGEKSSLVPMFTVTENGRGVTSSDDGKTAVLCGSRRIKNGRFSETFDSVQTAGLMLLEGRTRKITLNYLYNGAEKTCEAYGISVSPKDNGEIVVSAKFRTRSGTALPDGERETALKTLSEIVKASI